MNNILQLTAFPSQRELALITRETRRKMGRMTKGKGVTKANSLLHNALWGYAHAYRVLPDELILNSKYCSAKLTILQYPLCILSHGWLHFIFTHTFQHYHMHPFILSTQILHTARTVGAANEVTDSPSYVQDNASFMPWWRNNSVFVLYMSYTLCCFQGENLTFLSVLKLKPSTFQSTPRTDKRGSRLSKTVPKTF